MPCPSLKTGVMGGKLALRSENYTEALEDMFLYGLFAVKLLYYQSQSNSVSGRKNSGVLAGLW